MLAKSVRFAPQLRGTQHRARSPLGDQAYRGASEVLVPISSTKTKRSGLIAAVTITRQAALRNSRLSGKVAAGRCSRSASSSLLAPSSILGLEPGRFFGVSGLPSRAVAA